MKTFIIAEAGSNHNRDFNQALRLIDIAVEAKCNAVKFQLFKSETLYNKYTKDFAGYKNIPNLIKKLELPREWLKDLKAYCDEKNIEFLCTPFDEEAIDSLVSLGVKRLKVAGFESTDPRFIKLVAKTNLPLIISLGIAADKLHYRRVIDWVRDTDNTESITFLHCNNAYPTPFWDINLGSMIELKECLDIFSKNSSQEIHIGLSDHTKGILVPPVAVGLGAQYIEKHYTISKLLPGPDHHFAIELYELKTMVKNIRLVESTLGIKADKYTLSEEDLKIGTRSVMASETLFPGDILTQENVTTKRCVLEDSILAIDYFSVLGKKLKQKVFEDEGLKWKMISD